MKPSIEAALNRELYSSCPSVAMSAYYETCHLPGFGSWLRVQAKEELAHAMKFYDYVSEAGGRPVMDTIEALPREWGGPKAAFADVLAHEQAVTRMIGDLVELAIVEKDHATTAFLQWFVTEQVEEEKNASDILAQVEALGDTIGHLFWVDHHLGKRG